MKIKKSRNNKKALVILTVAALAVAGIGTGAWALYQSRTISSDNSPSKQNTNKNNDSQDSEDTSPPTDKNLPPKTKEPSTSTTPDLSNDSEDTTSQKIETPRLERADQSGSNIKVVASFQEPSSGACELQLTKASKTIKKTTRIVIGPSYYTCGFSVPTTELPQKGNWAVTVIHERGDAIASSSTRTIEVR